MLLHPQFSTVNPFFLLVLFLGVELGPSTSALATDSSQCSAKFWEHVPLNVWVKVPTCGPVPRKVFHGAATLAVDLGEVLFFGADTHEVDYDNSVTRLHLDNLKWSRDYDPDPIETYDMTVDGYPVTKTGRPWAMHAFDTWDYHPPTQTIIFVGHPTHAHKATHVLKEIDSQKLKPATWVYSPRDHKWRLLNVPTPNLFAQGLVWNPTTDQFIGHNGTKTFLFSVSDNIWQTTHAGSNLGWHRRLVHETGKNRILSLGLSTRTSDLWAYSPQVGQWHRLHIDNPPLPAEGAAIAYDSNQKVLLYLANDYQDAYNNPTGRSATFVFLSDTQRWKRLSVISPPLYGMNYLTQYDPVRGVFLHFEKASFNDQTLAVWAFKFSQ